MSLSQTPPVPPGPGSDADPITTEVIRHGLIAAADQMKLTMKRTAVNPVIYEIQDFSCALFDRRIQLLSQAETLPMFLGSMSFCVESAVARIGEANLEAGDIIISTYGYDIGSHQQDMAVMAPVFLDSELIGYAATKAHHLDIGAKDMYCTDTIDIFQEGAIFPSVRLYRKGVLQDDLYRTLLANSRLPKTLEGDLHSQIAAVRTGERELIRLISRYGLDVFGTSVERMFDHGETLVRRFLEAIPDGRYTGQGFMDSNGITDEPVPIEVTVEVAGDSVVVDLTANPPEQVGPINCPRAATVAAVRIAVIAVAGGRESVNQGHFRPIKVLTKPGTMFDPKPPAPIFMYPWPSIAAVDLIHRAMAEAIPEGVPAGNGGDICTIVWWGKNPDGSLWGEAMDELAGQGAAFNRDGSAPLMHISCSNIRNTPVEAWETRRGFVVERREYAMDSAGAGRYRGGQGIDSYYRALEECQITVPFERTKSPPWGLEGGKPARPNRFRIRYPDGSVQEYSKVTNLHVPVGAVLEVQSGGGGGFGAPAQRDPGSVHADVQEGFISETAARADYPHAYASTASST